MMFSTEESPGHGISTVKALALAAEEGQRIWTITSDNLDLALENIDLSANAKTDIRNAVNEGKVVTAHEAKLNFHGWVGSGYIIMDSETGAGAYLIGGGMSGGYYVVFDGDNHQVGFFRFVPIQTGNKLGFEAAVMYGELFFGEGSGMLGLYHWNVEVVGAVDSIFRTGVEASAKIAAFEAKGKYRIIETDSFYIDISVSGTLGSLGRELKLSGWEGIRYGSHFLWGYSAVAWVSWTGYRHS